MTVRYVELFAGIGGLGEGFKREGAMCVFANEFDRYAAKTYQANNLNVTIDVGDVRELEANSVPSHDVLLAGFPCQPFSIAGISKRNALGVATGMSCENQGTLFFHAARIIKAKAPDLVVLENVKNLVNHDKGRTFAIIRGTLEDLGYAVAWQIFDAAAWVPQHRERVFVVARRGNEACNLDAVEVPEDHTWPALNTVLHDGRETEEIPYTIRRKGRLRVGDKYTLTEHMWDYLQAYRRKHEAKGNGFGFSLVGKTDRARTLSSRYCKDGSEILVKQARNRPRRLTPRECSRLQGFDADRNPEFIIPVSDNQAYKQFGNAVAVPVANAIAKVALECL